MKYQLAFGLMTASLLAANAFAEESASAAENAGAVEASEEAKAPELAISGEVEFDAYSGDVINDDRQSHSYASTFDLNFAVKFNEQWSAEVQLEADGGSTDPTAVYNGAFIQYTKNENLAVKAGDLTFSEGAFINYYGYDDPADNAAGMAEHDIRGVEVDAYGFIVGLGLGRGDNDNQECVEEDGEESCIGFAYDAHLAYDLAFGEQVIRPYADYKAHKEGKHNELHAGVEATLKFGGLGIHGVYGFHADDVAHDDAMSAHAFLLEPSFETESFSVKATAFYAKFDNKSLLDHGDEIPEYFFLYLEPGMNLFGPLSVGVPMEYHTNTINSDEELESFNAGVRLYFVPVEGINVTGFAMANKPLGDGYGEDDDVGLNLGIETVFTF